MDSNFQVTITANIQDLVSRVSAIEKELGKISSAASSAGKGIKTSFDSASTSVTRVGVDMSRARLAAFAFGQVIRDAGFFSQNFGLGVLAISNNIPILIDQLVLLSGVSAAVGAAISLLGSALTAGLTVFAYWAQRIQYDGGNVGKEIQKMALDSETYIGQLVDFLSRPPASTLLNTIIGGFKEGFELLKQIAKAGIDLIIAIWNRFGTEINMVMGYIYTIVYNQMNNVLNIIKIATGLIKGDWNLVWEGIKAITFNVINSIISGMQTLLVGVSAFMGALLGVTQNAALGASVSSGGKYLAQLGDKLKIATGKTSDFNFVFKDLIKSFQFAPTAIDKTNKKIKTFGDELELRGLKTFNYETDQFLTSTKLLAKAGAVKIKTVDLTKGKGLGEHTDQYYKDLEVFENRVNDIFGYGLAETVSNSMQAVGEAIASGGNIGKALGDALLGGLSSVLVQFGQLLIATSFAGLQFSKAFKKLFDTKQWGIALAAGIALTALGGTLKGFVSSKSGGGGSSSSSNPTSGVFGGARPFAAGGIVSGPTNALIGEYPGARNNPEVVAPLDKLSGIIAGSISGGDMGGQLTARISGNDLVILLDRASKNRKNYF